MKLLLISYDKATDQLIAEINPELEVKVGYCPGDGTLAVIVKGKITKRALVGLNYPASMFIKSCLETYNTFNQVPKNWLK